jgi:hypothetical protein
MMKRQPKITHSPQNKQPLQVNPHGVLTFPSFLQPPSLLCGGGVKVILADPGASSPAVGQRSAVIGLRRSEKD